jgi:hypothetical protein
MNNDCSWNYSVKDRCGSDYNEARANRLLIGTKVDHFDHITIWRCPGAPRPRFSRGRSPRLTALPAGPWPAESLMAIDKDGPNLWWSSSPRPSREPRQRWTAAGNQRRLDGGTKSHVRYLAPMSRQQSEFRLTALGSAQWQGDEIPAASSNISTHQPITDRINGSIPFKPALWHLPWFSKRFLISFSGRWHPNDNWIISQTVLIHRSLWLEFQTIIHCENRTNSKYF